MNRQFLYTAFLLIRGNAEGSREWLNFLRNLFLLRGQARHARCHGLAGWCGPARIRREFQSFRARPTWDIPLGDLQISGAHACSQYADESLVRARDGLIFLHKPHAVHRVIAKRSHLDSRAVPSCSVCRSGRDSRGASCRAFRRVFRVLHHCGAGVPDVVATSKAISLSPWKAIPNYP